MQANDQFRKTLAATQKAGASIDTALEVLLVPIVQAGKALAEAFSAAVALSKADAELDRIARRALEASHDDPQA